MFFALLIVTFLVALLVSFLVARAFENPIKTILDRIVGAEMAAAWTKYMKFAIYVVGISGGVRIYELEKYLNVENTEVVTFSGATPAAKAVYELTLTPERWVLEIYRTIIETLQALAWMMLVFFLFALVAYVIVRIWGSKKENEVEKGS